MNAFSRWTWRLPEGEPPGVEDEEYPRSSTGLVPRCSRSSESGLPRLSRAQGDFRLKQGPLILGPLLRVWGYITLISTIHNEGPDFESQ